MYYSFINLLKAFAAVMITNSHMGDLYPLSFLSVGGAIGNTIFFLVSGFCISNRIMGGGWSIWLFERIKRVYVPTLFIGGILILIGDIPLDFKSIFDSIIFPIRFWFVVAILLYYIILLPVSRCNMKSLKCILFFSVLLYGIAYIFVLNKNRWEVEDGWFKYIFYFIPFLIGYMIKCNRKNIEYKICTKSKMFLLLSVISALMYILSRLLIMVSPSVMKLQFIVQIMTLLTGLFIFLFTYSIERSILTSHILIGVKPVIDKIANSTLEIYLVNVACIERLAGIQFPINVMLAFVVVFVVGTIMHNLIHDVTDRIHCK